MWCVGQNKNWQWPTFGWVLGYMVCFWLAPGSVMAWLWPTFGKQKRSTQVSSFHAVCGPDEHVRCGPDMDQKNFAIWDISTKSWPCTLELTQMGTTVSSQTYPELVYSLWTCLACTHKESQLNHDKVLCQIWTNAINQNWFGFVATCHYGTPRYCAEWWHAEVQSCWDSSGGLRWRNLLKNWRNDQTWETTGEQKRTMIFFFFFFLFNLWDNKTKFRQISGTTEKGGMVEKLQKNLARVQHHGSSSCGPLRNTQKTYFVDSVKQYCGYWIWWQWSTKHKTLSGDQTKKAL